MGRFAGGPEVLVAAVGKGGRAALSIG
jgi:hypothetical protein